MMIELEFSRKTFAVLMFENILRDHTQPYDRGVYFTDQKIDDNLRVTIKLTPKDSVILFTKLKDLVPRVSFGFKTQFRKKMNEIKTQVFALKAYKKLDYAKKQEIKEYFL